jgi:hypothetical protein
MEKSRVGEEFLDMLTLGSLQCSEQMLLRFREHIVVSLNRMIDHRTKRFIRELNRFLEFNDAAGVVALFRKYKKDMEQCMFFNKIAFIQDTFREELTISVENQTKAFLKKVVGHLAGQAADTGNPEMEDALYQIKRIRFFPDGSQGS